MFGGNDHSTFDILDHMQRGPWTIPETCVVVREQDVLLKQRIEVVEQEKAAGIKEETHREETAGRPWMIEAVTDSNLRNVRNSGM